MSDNNPISIELSANGILALTLNRPDKLNSLSLDTLSALKKSLTLAAEDIKVKAILITGTGKAFCAGADIKRLAELNAQSGYDFAQQGQALFRQLETLGKPTLAAINGFALGGGCELAMATSLRIAAEAAQFAQPEIQLGIIPGYGGTQRLARLVGKGRAIELCLTGRRIDAELALQWGLISEITSQEQLLPRAREILSQLISLPSQALSSILTCINHGYDLTLPDAMQLEALHFANLCATEDKHEGVNAFLEKRQPKFSD